jgi:hypothetical protein
MTKHAKPTRWICGLCLKSFSVPLGQPPDVYVTGHLVGFHRIELETESQVEFDARTASLREPRQPLTPDEQAARDALFDRFKD